MYILRVASVPTNLCSEAKISNTLQAAFLSKSKQTSTAQFMRGPCKSTGQTVSRQGTCREGAPRFYKVVFPRQLPPSSLRTESKRRQLLETRTQAKWPEDDHQPLRQSNTSKAEASLECDRQTRRVGCDLKSHPCKCSRAHLPSTPITPFNRLARSSFRSL